MRPETTKREAGTLCSDCEQPKKYSVGGAWVDVIWLCGDCLVKRASRLPRVEAERDYAIEQWVCLENKYEKPRHWGDKLWTTEEMLAEIRHALPRPEKKEE